MPEPPAMPPLKCCAMAPAPNPRRSGRTTGRHLAAVDHTSERSLFRRFLPRDAASASGNRASQYRLRPPRGIGRGGTTRRRRRGDRRRWALHRVAARPRRGGLRAWSTSSGPGLGAVLLRRLAAIAGDAAFTSSSQRFCRTTHRCWRCSSTAASQWLRGASPGGACHASPD